MEFNEGHQWKETASDIASGILMLIVLAIAIFTAAGFQP